MTKREDKKHLDRNRRLVAQIREEYDEKNCGRLPNFFWDFLPDNISYSDLSKIREGGNSDMALRSLYRGFYKGFCLVLNEMREEGTSQSSCDKVSYFSNRSRSKQ